MYWKDGAQGEYILLIKIQLPKLISVFSVTSIKIPRGLRKGLLRSSFQSLMEEQNAQERLIKFWKNKNNQRSLDQPKKTTDYIKLLKWKQFDYSSVDKQVSGTKQSIQKQIHVSVYEDLMTKMIMSISRERIRFVIDGAETVVIHIENKN